MVGIVEEVGSKVQKVKPGDRVTVNVETFCGECFFCKQGYVNNCTDQNGGWALGCRMDGGQAEYVRVPYADQGLNRIDTSITDEQALLVGDVLDVTGTAEQLGKPIGSDSENGKTTFATLFGVDGAMQLAEKLNDETCTALRDAFGEKSAFLEQLARTLLNRRS